MACAGCGTLLDAAALSCPSCRTLTRSSELESLAAQAQAASTRNDLPAARDLWEQASRLLPQDTVQYQSIRGRIADLDAQIAAHAAVHKNGWRKTAGAGSVLLLALSKGKLLLLGLTKLSTLLSMVAFAGVYWALYGWAFAIGLVLSIYIHEMGHVLTLRQYGIAADAPMFIPFFGAFIRLRQLTITPVQDARVGLAGPIYGLGAAIAALCLSFATGSKALAAIAHFGAVINLFNLIPVWQLDGSRGFRSLTREQRVLILATAGVLWYAASFYMAGEPMLLLIAIVSVFRLFTKDAAAEPDWTGFLQFAGLLASLSAVAILAQSLASK